MKLQVAGRFLITICKKNLEKKEFRSDTTFLSPGTRVILLVRITGGEANPQSPNPSTPGPKMNGGENARL